MGILNVGRGRVFRTKYPVPCATPKDRPGETWGFSSNLPGERYASSATLAPGGPFSRVLVHSARQPFSGSLLLGAAPSYTKLHQACLTALGVGIELAERWRHWRMMISISPSAMETTGDDDDL